MTLSFTTTVQNENVSVHVYIYVYNMLASVSVKNLKTEITF